MIDKKRYINFSITQEAWVLLHRYARENEYTMSKAVKELIKNVGMDEISDEEYIEEVKMKRGKS